MEVRKDEMLFKLLKKWFEEANWEKYKFTSRDRIAKLIKQELKEVNRWKNAYRK